LGKTPKMVVAMCVFMNRIYKKCKARRRKLTLMKIYLFAHGRCGTLQTSEHKILSNNLGKCDLVQCCKVAVQRYFRRSWKLKTKNPISFETFK
jgi:hypothetical protein